MQDDLLCIKIKDGLYIANRRPAEDVEFLLTNKFGYVLNCTNEIPNYFEELQAVRYLKLKYQKVKPGKLWGEVMKKLTRIYKFIEEADENAQCCLVHSNIGNNRCIAVIIAYLMKKFYWTFQKALIYVRSKKATIKLSQTYVTQLRQLELKLQEENPLSNDWRRPYMSEEERIVSNTYINTIEIKFEEGAFKEELGEKRVKWKDRIDKANNKEEEKVPRESKGSAKGKEKSQKQEKIPTKTHTFITTKKTTSAKKKNEGSKNSTDKSNEKKSQGTVDDSIAKLIKKKLKETKVKETKIVVVKKEDDEDDQSGMTEDQPSPHNPQPAVYNLTVNNFINPSINIYSKQQPKAKSQQKKLTRPASGDRRVKKQIDPLDDPDNKISRTFSQKDHRSLQRQRQKATNITASLMKSLIGLQADFRRKECKGDSSVKLNDYKSANFEVDRELNKNLQKLDSPKLVPKRMEKSMSFEGKKK